MKHPVWPRSMKCKQVYCEKHTRTFFFNVKNIVHLEFVPPRQSINSMFYCDVLRWLWEHVQQKKSHLPPPFRKGTTLQCTMTINRCTVRLSSSHFWPKVDDCCSSSTVFTRFSILWPQSVSKIKTLVNRTLFWHHWGNSDFRQNRRPY